MAAASSSPSSDSIYAQVDSYPWDTDAEFQSGLGAILGSTASPEQAVELSLRARCFYYSRKFTTPVDFDAYKAYRATAPSPSPVPTTATTPNGLATIPSPSQTPPLASSATFAAPAPTSAPSAVPPAEGEAPYPTSFAHIVELITSGQPIPGIKEIPDTVLAGQGSRSVASTRKKPWEKEGDTGAAAAVAEQ